jgi:hypothetical protein
MTTSATVPVTVTPEATARIAQKGFQAAVERMIDYARRHLPDLDRIDVELHDRYELGDEPALTIECYGRRPFDQTDRTDDDLGRWVISAFPPKVLEHLNIFYRPGQLHAG